MKSLVIYDSVYGNTKKIAEAINTGLSNKYKTRIIHIKDLKFSELTSVDLIVLGSPTHGGWYTQEIKEFLDPLPKKALSDTRVASFDTSIPQDERGFFVNQIIKVLGNAAPRILNTLKKKGANVLTSEIFWVLDTKGPLKEGEEKRASNWAAEL